MLALEFGQNDNENWVLDIVLVSVSSDPEKGTLGLFMLMTMGPPRPQDNLPNLPDKSPCRVDTYQCRKE